MIPFAIALSSWVVSLFVRALCPAGVPLCVNARETLSRIYMSLLVIGVIAFWAQIKGSVNRLYTIFGELSAMRVTDAAAAGGGGVRAKVD